jgi:type I restriction enzyme S subunit
MTARSWTDVPIKEVCSGFWDGPHATPKKADSGPVYLGIKNITDDGMLDLSEIRHISEEDYPKWTKRVVPEPGDIVFTYEATLHRYAIVPQGFRGCLGRRLALIRPDPAKIDGRFLFYHFFGTEWRRVISSHMILGATVDRIPLIEFPDFILRIPPLPVQRKIAAVLSAYDDLIENNTRRIEILEEMAQAIYREWFVRFRFPGHEDVPMVGSEIGPVPEGWALAQLGDLAQSVRIGVDPSEVDPGTPYFGLEHLPRKSITLAGWGSAQDVQSTKLAFDRGHILFGKIRPYFHKVGVAPVNGICSSDTIVIVPESSDVYGLVLGCVSSPDFVEYATRTSQGTKMPRANWDVMAQYPVLVPSPPILRRYNEMLSVVVAWLQNAIFRNRALRQTRDLLLPRLVSGELNISDLDILTGDGLG